MMELKIISGGQTGVDRAALDVALDAGISCGGYCPKGRKAEDGALDEKYPLKELESTVYRDRTEANIDASDGTLIITQSYKPSDGTAYTMIYAKRKQKPVFMVNMLEVRDEAMQDDFNSWLKENEVKVLNVAGPRESTFPGAYKIGTDTLKFLLNV